MILDVQDDLARVTRSQLKTWKDELEILRHDPTVQRFLELRENIVRGDGFVTERDTEQQSSPSWPFDIYDALEFARDLAGKDLSTFTLSESLGRRLPDMSAEARRMLLHFLIDNGRAEVIWKTVSGHPMLYRYAAAAYRPTLEERADLGVPVSELSRFKVGDLENIEW